MHISSHEHSLGLRCLLSSCVQPGASSPALRLMVITSFQLFLTSIHCSMPSLFKYVSLNTYSLVEFCFLYTIGTLLSVFCAIIYVCISSVLSVKSTYSLIIFMDVQTASVQLYLSSLGHLDCFQFEAIKNITEHSVGSILLVHISAEWNKRSFNFRGLCRSFLKQLMELYPPHPLCMTLVLLCVVSCYCQPVFVLVES